MIPAIKRRGRPRGVSAKSELTRRRIFQAALDLFATQGFEATTMRDVAARAGTSPGLAYRYFPAKEAFVLALYRQLSDEFAAAISKLPEGSIAQRFELAMRAKLHGMEPHRRTLGSLFSVGINPASKVYVLGSSTVDVREKVTEAMREVLRGSSQKLPDSRIESFSILLFVLQLAIVFCWIHDTTDGAGATNRLVSLASWALGLGTKLMKLPGVGARFDELPAALGPIFARTQFQIPTQ